MKKKLGIAVLWVVCGVFNWGATLGYLVGEYPTFSHRSNYGIAGFMALGSPIGTVVETLESNFFQHGFVWK